MSQKLLWAFAAMGFATLVSVSALAQGNDLSSRLLACRAIGDVTSRAACYDKLVDGLTTQQAPRPSAPSAPASMPAATPARPVAPPPAVAAPSARFGADDLPVQKRDPQASQIPDQIIAKAVSIKTDGLGFVTVTLDNGQTWRQTEGPALRVLPGAEVKIRSGLIGSYLMSLASGNRSVRAKRIN